MHPSTYATAIAALYALRASNETWIGGNQVERVDAALAELEAAERATQQAQASEWVPLPDGVCHDATSRYGEELRVNGERLDIYDYSFNTTGLPDMVFDLPPDVRLCRLVAQE